jgi:HK97 family phage major capsid protein
MDKENQVIEMDAETLKSLGETIANGIMPSVKEAATEAAKAVIAESEKSIKKNVTEGGEGEEKPTEESKVKRLALAAIALVKNDTATLKEYNQKAIEARAKAGYNNAEVNADGGYVVLEPEFEAEIESLAEEYGVAFSDADVRNINSNAIKTNKRGSNVVMYETGAGQSKTGTKLTISQVTAELRKFAAIAIAVDEFTEDAAIDFWADVRQGFAEERARIADELIFTDNDADFPGILNTPGVAAVTVGSSIADASWDTLLDAEVAVPTRAMRNGKHYMHRTVWNVIRKSKDDEGRYQLIPSAGLTTPWGTPVSLVDVLPSVHEGNANSAYGVFGDLKRARLYVKRGLTFAVSNEATVTDADDQEIKLFEQDMTALRAVTRMVALIKFPEAFCIWGTGGVS